jgi:hypothetical protein
MTDSAYKPIFKWMVNSGFGMVDKLDTFRTYGNSGFRSDILIDWISDLEHELDIAEDDLEALGNIDGIDTSKLHDAIEGNIRYYKPTFCWDLDDINGHIGNLDKFRKLHPVFRVSVLRHWIADLEYASRVSYFDLVEENKIKIKKKHLTSSST